MAGPFTRPPFTSFQNSPISLKEKDVPGKFRMIHNLSFPHDGSSVNANISDFDKSVKFSNIRQAITIMCNMPKNSYSAKSDVKNAFGIIPVHEDDYSKLVFNYKSRYYFCKTLPQGAGSSCRIFEQFATALQHIVKFHIEKCHLIHYLDDFLFIAPTENLCKEYLKLFKSICLDIGIPLSIEKTTEPSTSTIFLGIELNTRLQCAKLPIEKITSYSTNIKDVMEKRTITKRTLQSIIGKLSFASAVIPARPFLRRLINLLPQVKEQHHYITLNREVKLDLATWYTFLKQYNGITFFRSLNIIDSSTLNMCSDASHIGFGATFRSHWIQSAYPEQWKTYHITLLELYPVYVMLVIFGHTLTNRTVRFWCDNISVCYILNKLTSKDSHIMSIIRKLIICLVKYNVHIIASYIPGTQNTICDKLSRFQATQQDLRHSGLTGEQMPIPTNLLPENFILQ